MTNLGVKLGSRTPCMSRPSASPRVTREPLEQPPTTMAWWQTCSTSCLMAFFCALVSNKPKHVHRYDYDAGSPTASINRLVPGTPAFINTPAIPPPQKCYKDNSEWRDSTTRDHVSLVCSRHRIDFLQLFINRGVYVYEHASPDPALPYHRQGDSSLLSHINDLCGCDLGNGTTENSPQLRVGRLPAATQSRRSPALAAAGATMLTYPYVLSVPTSMNKVAFASNALITACARAVCEGHLADPVGQNYAFAVVQRPKLRRMRDTAQAWVYYIWLDRRCEMAHVCLQTGAPNAHGLMMISSEDVMPKQGARRPLSRAGRLLADSDPSSATLSLPHIEVVTAVGALQRLLHAQCAMLLARSRSCCTSSAELSWNFPTGRVQFRHQTHKPNYAPGDRLSRALRMLNRLSVCLANTDGTIDEICSSMKYPRLPWARYIYNTIAEH